MSLLKIGELKIKPTKLVNTGAPYYVFSGSIDTDVYEDVTSNEKWMSIGVNQHDYLFCRNQVILNTATIGWTSLTSDEKVIAAKNFAIGETERLEIFSNSELQIFWKSFVNISQDNRDARWKSAKGYISFNLSMDNSIDLGKETNSLTEDYIKYGVESFALDNNSGLFDYLENTSSYSGSTGFSGKTYWTQEHVDNMMTILRDGNY